MVGPLASSSSRGMCTAGMLTFLALLNLRRQFVTALSLMLLQDAPTVFCLGLRGKGKKKVGVFLLFWQKAVNLRFTNYYLLLRGLGQGPFNLRFMIDDCGFSLRP